MNKSWLRSNSICLALGDAVAKNLMFESKADHTLFFQLWKKYLGDMATLINYQLSPTGWTLLFRTKSNEDIVSAYQRLRSQSKKAKDVHTLKDISRILSEHFRIFLSQYVRKSNAYHNRKGTKVKQRFSKYVVDETKDYEALFDMITAQKRRQPQVREKYEADESGYDIEKEMLQDSIWKVGSRLYMGLEVRFRIKFGVELLLPKNPILRNYLNAQNSSDPPRHFT